MSEKFICHPEKEKRLRKEGKWNEYKKSFPHVSEKQNKDAEKRKTK